MSRKDDQGRKPPKGVTLSDADRVLWRQYTRDIDPIHPQDEENNEPPPPLAPIRKTPPETTYTVPPVMNAPVNAGSDAAQIDRRTEDRLRRGKIEIEARIDLHGYTQERAYDALGRFIDGAIRRGLRCVLVITGKGRSSHDNDEWTFNDGVLRARLPEWLSSPPYGEHVLRCVLAQPRDGGEGAYYVYLRKKRN